MPKKQNQLLVPSPSTFAPSAALNTYLKEVDACVSLTDTETRTIIARLRRASTDHEHRKLLEHISNAYLSYVVEVAKSFIDVELILVDYIQEGNLSLMEAIHSYDHTGTESFLDFLTPRLYRDLQQYENDNPLPKNIHPPVKTVSKKKTVSRS